MSKENEILEALSLMKGSVDSQFDRIINSLQSLNERISKIEETSNTINTLPRNSGGFDWSGSQTSESALSQPQLSFQFEETSTFSNYESESLDKSSETSVGKKPKGMAFKLAIVGPGGVGKTTLISKLFGVEIPKDIVPTKGVLPPQRIELHSTHGKLHFDIYDVGGSGQIKDIPYFGDVDCGILMFDVTSRDSYKAMPEWHRYLRSIMKSTNAPIVLVGNKVDCVDRRVKAKMITFHRKKNLQYYDISAHHAYNLMKPFLWLARKLVGLPDLFFVRVPELKEKEQKEEEEGEKV